MRVHNSKVSSACFFHLRRFRRLRYIISTSMMQHLVSAFVLSRMDYCNSVFAGLPDTTLSPVRRAMNAAIRLLAGLGPHHPVRATMRELHWLPISFRIKYKLCLLMYAAVNGFCPEYISNILIPVSVLPGRAAPRPSTPSAFEFLRTRTCEMEQSTSIA